MEKDLFGKHFAFRSIIMLLVMMFTGLMANADTTESTGKAKTKPYIYISHTGYGDMEAEPKEPTTYLNDAKFIEPAIIVYEDNSKTAAITNRFYISYYLTSGSADGTKGTDVVEKGKTWNVDATTGTRVNTRYGDIETGKTAGIVYVHVVATPSDRYTDQFEATESVYRITLNKVHAEKPLRIVPQFVTNDTYRNAWYAATGTAISLPDFKIEYTTTDNNGNELTLDITKRFNITATVGNTTLATVVDDYKYNSLESGNAELSTSMIKTGNTAGTVDVKFSFTPLYANAYEPISDFTLPLNIVDEKVTPQLIFPSEEQLAYTGMRGVSAMRPTVYDQFGNDITPSVAYNSQNDKPLWIAWSAAPLADGKTMHTPLGYCNGQGMLQEWGSQPLEGANLFRFNNGGGVMMYGPDNIDTGSLVLDKTKARNEFETPTDDYNALNTCKVVETSAKIYCQVYPRAYDNAAANKYAPAESSYLFRVKPRPLQIVLTPQPGKVNVTKETKIDMYNRFEVTGVHTAEFYDSKFDRKEGETFTLYHNSENKDFGCQYTFKFKHGEAKINNYPIVAEQYEPIVVDKDGNRICKVKDFTLTDEQIAQQYPDGVWEVYWSMKGDNRDSDWTLEFLKDGNVKITYALYPYNVGFYQDGQGTTTVEETFNVDEKITPVVKVTPDPMILYTTDDVFPSQPFTTVTDGLSDDISSHYDLKFTLPDELKEAGIDIDANGNFVINDKSKLTKGEYVVTVDAIPKEGDNQYTPGQTSFRIIVKDLGDKVRFTWAVYNGRGGASLGNGTQNIPDDDKKHGKLVFTGAGAVSGGYSIDAIPGLAVQFGVMQETTTKGDELKEDAWFAKVSDTNDKVIVYGDPVEVNEKGIPSAGTFYILTPHTNGFLTIDAKFKKGNSIVLIDKNGKEKQTIEVKTEDEKPERQFRYPIYANTTYYMYNNGDATSYEPLRLHGISFEPGFINQRNDMKPIEFATAYANGFSGSLPSLTNGKTLDDCVSYAIDANKVDATDNISDYAEITQTGVVTTKKKGTAARFLDGATTIAHHGNLQLKKDYLKVYAEVKSAYKGGETMKKVPAYDLYIGDIPTYIMTDGYTPDVLERITTTNYPTKVRAFFGGWESGENRPYIKNNKINETDPDKIVMLVDSWKTSKMDSVGSNNRVVDNFAFASFGTQNATSETVVGTYKYSKDNEDQTYNLPCRGTYLQFEPNESGTIAVYIIQNGMVAYDGDPDNASKSGMNKIKLNPVFITDETGTPVKLAEWDHTMEGAGSDAYTEAVVRCNYEDILRDCCKDGQLDSGSDATAISVLEKLGYIPTDGAQPQIKKGDTQNVVDIAKVLDKDAIAGSMGYSVITKAYTRYSFDVKAGKSYFLFMNGSKLGNNGFAFMPNGWTPNRTETTLPQVTLDEKGTAEGSKDEFIGKEENFSYYDTPVDVKLYHSFKPEQWTALSLPFSINTTQFQDIFGEDAWVISLDEVADNREVEGETYDNVALFTQHNYHWIVAGRPYFVKPGKNFHIMTDEDGRQYIDIKNVTFEHAQYDAASRTANNGEYIGTGFVEPKTLTNNKEVFNFVASYDKTTIEPGDYYVGSTRDGDAKLYRTTSAKALNGYRAFIRNKSENSEARLGSFSYGDFNENGDRGTTAIEAIFDAYDENAQDSAVGKKGVYTVDGRKVADSKDKANKLPAGVYVVDGQTFVK